jgi:hypothetical protein
MDLLYSVFLGAGLAGFAYTKIGRRVGYENNGNIFQLIAITFILGTIVFFTILDFILGVK